MSDVCVVGLWHLGCVTAACLAEAGMSVVGLDSDAARVVELNRGSPPVAEPGLSELLEQQCAVGRLRFSSDPADALRDPRVLCVAYDTPVDHDDRADTEWVRREVESLRPYVSPETLVLVSSQVPVGFTGRLESSWRAHDSSLQFAYSPENLRLGQALDAFRHPDRIVIGLGSTADRQRLLQLFHPFSNHLEWMTLASAEMTKHALNGFLATSIAFTNELARICERVGADAGEVERGLRSEPRIGPRAYVTPGPPFAGGTLARDIQFLSQLARTSALESPVMDAVWQSNQQHKDWVLQHVVQLVRSISSPRVALLGLTYKAGTDTLRRSSAAELARQLYDKDIGVTAFDPAVKSLPAELASIELKDSARDAMSGADVTVIATPWPAFRDLKAEEFVSWMRRPAVIDPFGLLKDLGSDTRITYRRVGSPLSASSLSG